jgi:hypothetical protein
LNRIAATLISVIALTTLALAAVACGDSEESTSTTAATESTTDSSDSTTESTTKAAFEPGSCSPVEVAKVEPGFEHVPDDLTAEDYPTNPPTGGDHNDDALQTGQFYDQPVPLGEAVHALEHGAVVGWTNELSTAERKAVEEAFNKQYSKGYFQLAVVENPDLEVPFALSAWGVMQTCDGIDPDAIASFIEEHYAPETTAEGGLACSGEAKKLPACATRDD